MVHQFTQSYAISLCFALRCHHQQFQFENRSSQTLLLHVLNCDTFSCENARHIEQRSGTAYQFFDRILLSLWNTHLRMLERQCQNHIIFSFCAIFFLFIRGVLMFALFCRKNYAIFVQYITCTIYSRLRFIFVEHFFGCMCVCVCVHFSFCFLRPAVIVYISEKSYFRIAKRCVIKLKLQKLQPYCTVLVNAVFFFVVLRKKNQMNQTNNNDT